MGHCSDNYWWIAYSWIFGNRCHQTNSILAGKLILKWEFSSLWFRYNISGIARFSLNAMLQNPSKLMIDVIQDRREYNKWKKELKNADFGVVSACIYCLLPVACRLCPQGGKGVSGHWSIFLVLPVHHLSMTACGLVDSGKSMQN